MVLYFDSKRLLVAHKIYYDKTAPVLEHCNFSSVSSLNFSCKGCVGKNPAASYPSRCQKECDRLRSWALTLTADAV